MCNEMYDVLRVFADWSLTSQKKIAGSRLELGQDFARLGDPQFIDACRAFATNLSRAVETNEDLDPTSAIASLVKRAMFLKYFGFSKFDFNEDKYMLLYRLIEDQKCHHIMRCDDCAKCKCISKLQKDDTLFYEFFGHYFTRNDGHYFRRIYEM